MNNPFKDTDPSGYNWLGDSWNWVTRQVGNVLIGVASLVVTVVAVAIAAPVAIVASVVGIGVGVVKGVITGDWSMLHNDIKILGGLFQGSPQQIISRLTYELPQTLTGLAYSQIRNIGGAVDRVDYFDGATYVTNENSKNYNGITMGSYINTNIPGEIKQEMQKTIFPKSMAFHGMNLIILL